MTISELLTLVLQKLPTNGLRLINAKKLRDVLNAIIAKTGEIEEALPAPKPYSLYIATLNQSGTDAPTAVELVNELGGTVVWTRSDSGQYMATLEGAFAGNVQIIPPCDTYGANGLSSNEYSAARIDDNSIYLHTSLVVNNTGVKTYGDDCLYTGYSFIEIKVFQ